MASQKEEMLKIHKNIFQFLVDRNLKEPSEFFTMRETNRSNRLSESYYFLGNDNYMQVSFWKGKDKFQKVSRIGFFVEKRKKGWVSNIYLTCKDAPDLDLFFSDLSIKLGGFVKKSKHLWQKQYSSLNYIENLKEFINNDKQIIDEVINNNIDSPITMIEENDFKNNLKNVLSYKNRTMTTRE